MPTEAHTASTSAFIDACPVHRRRHVAAHWLLLSRLVHRAAKPSHSPTTAAGRLQAHALNTDLHGADTREWAGGSPNVRGRGARHLARGERVGGSLGQVARG
jgi:hypothetical protein